MGEMAASPTEPLPLGFRFHPTEEELVSHYLRRKITGQIRPEIEVIPEIDIYKYEPWELPDKSLIRSEDPEWFFFSQKDRKYPNGHRSNRATKAGYWKATGRDRIIRSKTPPASIAIGMKKILVFHQGRAPKGVHTNWIMHEYRASEPEFGSSEQGGYVLYRLFRKVAEKNVYCNREETERSSFSHTLTKLSSGDTQPEGDELEELVATIMEKPINQVSSVLDLQEGKRSPLDTVENQSSGITGWLADKEDCDSPKVEDSHCNNHIFLDVESNHEARGGGTMVDRFLSVPKSSSLFRTTTATTAAETKPPSNITGADPILDAITTSGDTLAPILLAAQVELTADRIPSPEASVAYTTETSGEDSSTLSRGDNSALSTDPNLCHDTAIDGLHASCKVEDTDEPQPSRSALANHPQHKFEGKGTVLSPEVLPLGFRFHPTDEELVQYLKKKIKSRRSEIRVIPEIDVCKCEPWELPYISPLGSGASEWFFFSSKDRKYPTGNRSNRATRAGYWKVSGKDRIVRSKAPAPPGVIGTKKSLIFYRGRAPKGVHTYWVMHEYTATEPEFEIGDQGGYVLYRLFRKIDGKYQICNEHEVDRSGLSSSPTKSSPGDAEHEGDSLEELDAPINQTSPVSDSQEHKSLLNLQEEQKSLAKIVENQPSVVTLANKADCSFIKPESSFSNGHAIVDLEGDYEVKPGGSFVSRCLSSLFTSSATRRPRQIIEVGPFLDANTKLRDNIAPITFAALSKVPADQIPASVSPMADTSDAMVNDPAMLLRIDTHPMNIDPSPHHAQSCIMEDNDETRHSSSTLAGQMQECSNNDLNAQLTSIATQAASCNTLSSSSVQSTDSSHISSHLMLLRSLFSKSLSDLTLEQFKEGAEAAKIVSSTSGMHRDLAKHLQSVIDQAYALRIHLDHQNHIIGVNTEPIDQLERLEADMPQFVDRLEALKLEIDQTAALVLQARLQSKGSDDNLAELSEEQARLSSVVASKEHQISKLRGEKSRHELTISLAVDFIKKLEAEFAALAEPFRDYFVPAK